MGRSKGCHYGSPREQAVPFEDKENRHKGKRSTNGELLLAFSFSHSRNYLRINEVNL